VLVKTGAALERFAEIDCVVFDKTGTLTYGQPDLLDPETIADGDLRLAASLGAISRHPLSQAVVRAAEERFGTVTAAPDALETAGAGVEAGGVRIGSAAWCGIADALPQDTTTLWLTRPGVAPVAFRFHDRLRPDARAAVEALHRRGLHTVILSGDEQGPVTAVARELGIAEAHARLSPKDKIAYLEHCQANGQRVLMVGDGLNDAPALAAANASLSPATAADISQTAADMVFQGASLSAVPEAIDVAEAARRRVFENFGLAVAYNAVSIPFAVMGYVTPLLAAAVMSTSSILVTLNALRLRARSEPWTR
jgi:Cu2+-exporting ATPase